MKCVYGVTFTFETLVLAEDEKDAYLVASDVMSDVVGDMEPDTSVYPVHKMKMHDGKEHWMLPSGWNMNCLPYGNHDDKTLGSALDEQDEYDNQQRLMDEYEKRQLKIPGTEGL